MNAPVSNIPDYIKSNTLLLPQSLYKMEDAHVVMDHGDAAIFYKNINSNLLDIEFYTNAPCLAFVLKGVETFTSYNHDHFTLNEEEMILMPKDQFMISDFKKQGEPLEAFLFFFDRPTIEKFLKQSTQNKKHSLAQSQPYKIPAYATISEYMNALLKMYRNIQTTANLLQIKLLELLHLIDALDDQSRLRSFLDLSVKSPAKRNIKKLMRDNQHANLSIADYAELSGRSMASFTRDFKRHFGTTPRQWQIDMRLTRAYDLIKENQTSITEIAMEVGYDNISHFIKMFKNKYGISPKKIQMQHSCTDTVIIDD